MFQVVPVRDISCSAIGYSLVSKETQGGKA